MKEGTSASKRACIFCSASTDLTREHLLPDWLQDVLPNEDLVVHYRVLGRGNGDRVEWTARPFRQRVRFVCRSCNNGWMSRLEAAVKPAMIPMLNHRACVVDRRTQALLATWALKTCLVFQATQTDAPIAPRSHYEYLARHSTPPAQVSVWLTSHYRARFDEINSVYLQRPLGMVPSDVRLRQDEDVGYLSFLAVGWIGFVVVGHVYASDSHVSYDGQFGADALLQLWPPASEFVEWPPRAMMDQDLVEALVLPEEGFSLVLRPSEQRRTA